jgi:hypothetical protein
MTTAKNDDDDSRIIESSQLTHPKLQKTTRIKSDKGD